MDEPFFLISRLHGRVVEGKPDGYGKMMPLDITNPKQKWVETGHGNQFINVATKKPLYAGNGRAWTFGSKMRVVNPLFGTILYCPWANQDGKNAGCGQNSTWADPTQLWMKVTEKELSEPIEGQRFRIKSDYDGRVIEGKANGDGMMNTTDASNLNQLWVPQAYQNGYRLMNVGTKLPLMLKDVSVWTYTQDRTIEDANNPGYGIDRTWGKEDGRGIVYYKIWYGIIHFFNFIEV